MKDRKVRLTVLVFLCVALAVPLSGAYGQPIQDTGHVNLVSPQGLYDYRDTGTYTGSVFGAEGSSGAYFQVAVGVVVGSYLAQHSDVTSIVARHVNSGLVFDLLTDVCPNYLGSGAQYWYIFLRPEEWMFEGNWEFTMNYNGSDANVHTQQTTINAFPKVFPDKPSHIKIVKDTSITVSWTTIGDPGARTDYRMLVYDGACPIQLFRGNWAGSGGNFIGVYDQNLHRVTFTIPLAWSGYQVRLETRFMQPGVYGIGRAMQYAKLP